MYFIKALAPFYSLQEKTLILNFIPLSETRESIDRKLFLPDFAAGGKK
jgi:hypothetical protein